MLHHEKTFNQWQPALFDGQFHWDFLLPAWMPTPIQPMDVDAQMTVFEDGATSNEAHDIDAKIERRGHRLIFETKSRKSIDTGPLITLNNEWKIGATILFLNGKTAETITGYAVYKEGGYSNANKIPEDPELTPCNAFDIIYLCRSWFMWAQGMNRQTRKEWDTQLWKWDYERRKPWCEFCRDEIRRKGAGSL